jgi:hypothetical protein
VQSSGQAQSPEHEPKSYWTTERDRSLSSVTGLHSLRRCARASHKKCKGVRNQRSMDREREMDEVESMRVTKVVV